MASFKENLILSQIAYNNFFESGKREKMTVGGLLKDKESSLYKYLSKKENAVWREHLETMKDWQLINFQSNTKSGFSGCAFKSPTGEIVGGQSRNRWRV